jgi:hypothetical protein
MDRACSRQREEDGRLKGFSEKCRRKEAIRNNYS